MLTSIFDFQLAAKFVQFFDLFAELIVKLERLNCRIFEYLSDVDPREI